MIAISLQTAEPSFLPHDFAFKLLNLALKGQKESQIVYKSLLTRGMGKVPRRKAASFWESSQYIAD